MNAQMKKQLETVITSIVEENTEEAKKAFHDYLRAKTQAILIGESDDGDADDEDKDEDEDKDDDKEDKAPPFVKKDKKDKKDKKKDDDSDDEDEDDK